MRFRERGLSPAAVVIIIIIIIAVAAGVYFLTRGRLGPGGLPLYSGASEREIPSELIGELEKRLPAGVENSGYSITENYLVVKNWYKGQMGAQGWELYSEEMIMGIPYLIYTKGNDGAGIIVGEYEGYTLLVLMYGSKDVLAI